METTNGIQYLPAAMSIEEKVREFIRRHSLLEEGERVLVAVSGGPDSLCLMGVMQTLQFDVQVAHFDHGLRAGSLQDSAWVNNLAQTCRLAVVSGRGDVRAFARSHKQTIEEAARRLRYEFLYQQAGERKAIAIATGHTRDDQAETVLMHLIRGAGLHGLAGIRFKMPVDIRQDAKPDHPLLLIRPLLCLTREQTEAYCRERGWEPLRDSSNQDKAFLRNRIRLEILPMLRSYNPKIIDVLCRLAELMAAQVEYLDGEIQTRWMTGVRKIGPDELSISRDLMQNAPHAIRQGIVRWMVGKLNPGLQDLAYQHVERAIEFCLLSPQNGRADLALGLEMKAEGETVLFRKKRMGLKRRDWEGTVVPLPGKLQIRGPDLLFETESLPTGEKPILQTHMPSSEAWVDLDKLSLPLYLRTRKTGERWTPLGVNKPVNLANFLSAQHWPLSKRESWPIVCDQKGIVWIPGLRLGEEVRITEKTIRCVGIRMKSAEE